MDHWFKDSPKRIDKDNGKAGWQLIIQEAEVKGGIRIDGTQEQLQVQGGARPVAQSSANTPRHDSSTSDIMKLQTMGGPPEELWNGLLDDTKRQSSRTNSTRVVASMVPV
ncbi:unnamed protein product [Boreogadus saida]